MKTLVIPVLTVLVIAAAMCFQGLSPKPTLADAPAVSLPDIEGCTVSNLPPSEAELTVLPRDTRIEKRLYQEPSGHWFMVSLVIGGREKGSIHRPELCLPSQGFLMTEPHAVDVGQTPWRILTLASNDGTGRGLGFAYTFFNQEGFRTSSHVRRIFRDVLDRSLLARIDRWVMVTVLSSWKDDREMVRFLSRIGEELR